MRANNTVFLRANGECRHFASLPFYTKLRYCISVCRYEIRHFFKFLIIRTK